MALAVYGKHPGWGDFVSSGLPGPLLARLEVWLDATLAACRDDLGAEWPKVWAEAPPLRFWLGEAAFGQVLCGVLLPSQDRVGRRFPLLLMALGGPPPPVVDPSQGWYADVEAWALGLSGRSDLAALADLLAGMPEPEADTLGGPADFWAAVPGATVEGLLADIALTDHRRAAAGRSYWWVAGEDVAPEPAASPEAAALLLATEEPTAPPAETEAAAPEAAVPADPWEVPEPEDAASPFDSGGFSGGLFAPPLAATDLPPPPAAQPAPAAPRPRPARWSRVHAGPGLPSGPVLAWLLRAQTSGG